MSLLYKRLKKRNEIQLTKNKIDLKNRKCKIIHNPPSEESHLEKDPLGKGSRINSRGAYLYLSKYSNNKHNIAIFNKKWKKYNEIQLTKNKMDFNSLIMKNHPPSPETSH